MSARVRRGGGGGGGGGGMQFPVGRRRHVPVVDAGCGCRPRRPRLLRLPSFLKPCQLGKPAPRSGGVEYSSTSTASFSSSSAATHSTGYSSAYSSDYYSTHAYGAAKQEPPLNKVTKAVPPTPAAAKKELSKKTKMKRCEKTEAAAEGVGVAVEKESSDPRADFRESMVQMVVEMGLCDWDGLRCILRRLLALNAPRHHAAILTAFAEVCVQIVSSPTAPQPPPGVTGW
ncbi:transcription repressor OFP8-like [Phragmites australis]|uniref:transcription repressor OFP8-like n=1 Tax=Phragmites australis TaxID=29695 RepID=UPI002D7810E6|nr:transcription repressor OFP8-like [Phragmites australis]